MVYSLKIGGILVAILAVVGGGVGALAYANRTNDSEAAVSSSRTDNSTQSAPVLTTMPADSASSKSPAVSGQTGISQNQNSIAGAVSGQSQSASPAPAKTETLPVPADFKQYDKYASNADALYIDVKAGTGAAVAKGSVVNVNYRGWLTDGTKFDDSYARGQPFSFTEGAGAVVRGWEEGLFGMKVGGQRRLVVPPGVGYGAAGMGPIPPNAVLVFDVELVSVQ